MLSKIELLLLIFEENDAWPSAYFINKDQKILLREEITNWCSKTEFTPSDFYIYLQKLKLKPLYINLDPNMRLARLVCINSKQQTVTVELTIRDAILLAQFCEVEMFIDQNYLKKEGMVISKKFIEEILKR